MKAKLSKTKEVKKYLLISFVFSALAYIFVFQGGNLQHEYYQILILPVFAIMIGLGVSFVFDHKKEFINPIFVDTLAPPIIATIGFLGLLIALDIIANSFLRRSPP